MKWLVKLLLVTAPWAPVANAQQHYQGSNNPYQFRPISGTDQGAPQQQFEQQQPHSPTWNDPAASAQVPPPAYPYGQTTPGSWPVAQPGYPSGDWSNGTAQGYSAAPQTQQPTYPTPSLMDQMNAPLSNTLGNQYLPGYGNNAMPAAPSYPDNFGIPPAQQQPYTTPGVAGNPAYPAQMPAPRSPQGIPPMQQQEPSWLPQQPIMPNGNWGNQPTADSTPFTGGQAPPATGLPQQYRYRPLELESVSDNYQPAPTTYRGNEEPPQTANNPTQWQPPPQTVNPYPASGQPAGSWDNSGFSNKPVIGQDAPVFRPIGH